MAITFTGKSIEIVARHFTDGFGRPYAVSRLAAPNLQKAVRMAKRNGGNPYDAAIFFMIMQTEAMFPEMLTDDERKWVDTTKQRCFELSGNGIMARRFMEQTGRSISGGDAMQGALASATLIEGFLSALGIYDTPLKMMKPQVIAYIYGWCDAAVQMAQVPAPASSAVMIAALNAIYGGIRLQDGRASGVAEDVLRRATSYLQDPKKTYQVWFLMGGNEFQALIADNDELPSGLLEALEA